ncbi:MaoC family dehydratase [Hyphomicrobiaceae bacterium 22]|uniref:MaoC family dehydratase n=2 Tax=Prosthecodimorpha staleyi TaxID=2840188 RepID=A0A947D6W7_9HYPH|nr:MaoC family dehydratase [Prosthecodimorpha staleyi]
MMWYEDIEPGRVSELGSYTFTADDIVGFARQFDPQPFHLSDEAARNSLFGRLAASGWQTASVFMKLNVERIERNKAAYAARGETPPALGPSPGFDNMRWPRPVLAGDTVTYRSTTLSKRLSATRAGWGLFQELNEGFNQNGDKVFEFTANVFTPVRDPGAA